MGLRADSSHGARAWPADRHATGSHANPGDDPLFYPKDDWNGCRAPLSRPWMLAMLVEFTEGLYERIPFLLG